MRFTRLSLKNWRNFLDVDVALQERVFLVGPNACGKSNLLRAFRFLRDIAEPRGGMQHAVANLGGISRLRSLHARRYTDIVIEVTMDLASGSWTYRLVLNQNNLRQPVVKEEKVWKGDEMILDRPDQADRADPGRLSQTHLEQVNANQAFREVAEFFTGVRYLHLVPQIIREPERYPHRGAGPDPYGGDFLETLARAQKEQRRVIDSRLKRINEALRVAVPQLKDLRLERDEMGRPHLRGLYEHWRPDAGWQGEDQFSDGTLRLLGLLWSMLDGTGPLLLEEPELSLHEALVRHLPAMMWKATRKNRRQVLVSTHSQVLLSDRGIAPEEVLLLRPTGEDTTVSRARDLVEVNALLERGLTLGEAVLPAVAPSHPEQLAIRFGSDR